MKTRSILILGTLAGLAACAGGAPETAPGVQPAPRDGAAPEATYWAYVGAESADLIHRVRFGPEGAAVEKTVPVGELSVETEGPHGLAISRDGRFLYLTTGHGVPDGKLWKIALGPDTLAGAPILLGRFPATLDVTPDGLYAFAVNFNLHGEHVPSTMSVVYTPELVEVEQVELCTMPHGSRLGPEGTHAYTACMMDDQVVEIDTRSFRVSRRFSVARGDEGPIAHDGPAGHAGHATAPASCSPTWAQPGADGSRLYVACNRSDEILELSTADWTLVRRFATGRAPYNLAVTPDGRLLVATLKAAGAVQFFDLASGESLATVPSSTTVTHGVAVTPDSRYAFVSSEGKGAEPGRVDVYDLRSLERVGSVEVGQQAGGIAFWKMER